MSPMPTSSVMMRMMFGWSVWSFCAWVTGDTSGEQQRAVKRRRMTAVILGLIGCGKISRRIVSVWSVLCLSARTHGHNTLRTHFTHNPDEFGVIPLPAAGEKCQTHG